MINHQETALFEALNAKKLTPREIAASFVVPAQYEQLVGPDHSLLIGPRGSGKTTLLRMLEGESLMAWEGERAEVYRSRVRYSSVFLPADRLWESQAPPRGPDDPLGVAAFCTQMLYALVEIMLYRLGEGTDSQSPIHLPAQMSEAGQTTLVEECAEAWRLKLRTKTLLGLQGAIDLRLNRLATALEANGSESQIDEESLQARPLESFRFGIHAFNRAAHQPHHRWALLLDEMELAPESVHHALRGSLRGGDKSLILKLSFSPSDRFALSTTGIASAAPDNDFRPIYLWYGTRIGGRRFSRGLWNRMMVEARGSSRAVASVLGNSEIDTTGATWGSNLAYNPGSRQLRMMKRMQARDHGFAEYLRRQRVDLDHLDSLSYERRSATLRKVYPLLVFRDAVLTFEGGEGHRRARKKVTECFSGSDAVFAALEGNPRWVKAVLSKLIAAYDGRTMVGRGFQFDTLKEAAERFEALLRLLPYEGQEGGSVLDLLDDIAAFFSDRAFSRFTADPVSAFRVDEGVSSNVIEALTIALSAGAVVHLRSKRSPVILSDLHGERFRLTYLLAVRDGLEFPLRIGKTTSLSRILDWANRRQRALVAPQPRKRLKRYPGELTLWDPR